MKRDGEVNNVDVSDGHLCHGGSHGCPRVCLSQLHPADTVPEGSQSVIPQHHVSLQHWQISARSVLLPVFNEHLTVFNCI